MSNNFPFESFTNTDEALIHVDKSESHREFMLCRASAIEQYAHFEYVLFRVYVYLSGDTEENLGDFYFNKLNAQSRRFWISFKNASVFFTDILHPTVAGNMVTDFSKRFYKIGF